MQVFAGSATFYRYIGRDQVSVQRHMDTGLPKTNR